MSDILSSLPAVLEDGAAPETPATAAPGEPGLDRLRRWAGVGNIAAELDDAQLGALAQRVLMDFRIDDDSRGEWKDKYRKWLKLATQVADAKTYPWPGASNILFPMLTTAALQFSARAYPAIVRGQDVVKGQVEGADDGVPLIGPHGPVMGPDGQPVWRIPPGAKRGLADRIGAHMSWQILREMQGWEEETDRLLLVLAIVGTMFRKTYYDPAKRRNVSELVESLRLCINYKAKSFEGVPRITEEIDLYPWEIEERIRGGVFLDEEYGANHDMSEDQDAPTTFLEQHRRWDLDGDGYAEPYIVTVARDSGRLARVAPGYDLDTIFLDEAEQIVRVDPVPYYTKYPFIPNPDSPVYDLGFGALLYPINDAVNSSLNQMFDAGHLANAGGGFIGSGMSMNTGSVNFAVGEFKMVNTPGATLRENLVPLNFPGPNEVLFQLLQFLVEAGREVASVKDVLTGEMPGANIPGILGLAVIQQGLKAFSATFKRIHRSLASEYAKLFRLNKLYLPDQSGYRRGETYFRISRQDYAAGHGVEPVSDPDAVTDIQQMARANFQLQFANDPWFDGREIRRRAFEAAAIPDIDKVLLKQPAPNPEILAKATELRIRAEHEAHELKIRGTRDKAAEVRDLAQAILYLAQAKKAEADVDGSWMDRQLELLKVQLDALTGGTDGAPGEPAGQPGGPVGSGLPGMAPPPGLAGGPAVPGGLPG